jgi:ketosteroid isomerase-like protein
MNMCFSTIKLDLKFTILEVTIDKDNAVVRSESAGTTTVLSDNQSAPDAYRELFVMNKEGGTWKNARNIYNKTK